MIANDYAILVLKSDIDSLEGKLAKAILALKRIDMMWVGIDDTGKSFRMCKEIACKFLEEYVDGDDQMSTYGKLTGTIGVTGNDSNFYLDGKPLNISRALIEVQAGAVTKIQSISYVRAEDGPIEISGILISEQEYSKMARKIEHLENKIKSISDATSIFIHDEWVNEERSPK